MGSAGALSGALRVNLLIRRGLREDAGSGPLTPRPQHPVYVRAVSGVCPVVVRVTKCYPCGEHQARCAMEYDQEKVDEMLLALLSPTP
jgi:hypothetical protein